MLVPGPCVGTGLPERPAERMKLVGSILGFGDSDLILFGFDFHSSGKVGEVGGWRRLDKTSGKSQ